MSELNQIKNVHANLDSQPQDLNRKKYGVVAQFLRPNVSIFCQINIKHDAIQTTTSISS